MSVRERIDRVLAETDIVAIVSRVVKLGKGKAPRGKCPFHGSNSDSFSVAPDPRRGAPFAHCFGCGWHGDVIKFVADIQGKPFIDALQQLEEEHGLDRLDLAPVHRNRAPQPRRPASREAVDSSAMGRFIWQGAKRDPSALRVYLRARGIPDPVLADCRFADLRFAASAPIVAWPVDRKPGSVPQAPAMVALVRRPRALDDGRRVFSPIGVHVTYLAPDLAGKMVRIRDDGETWPDRKMLGGAGGGCVLLPGEGGFSREAALFPGEGIETVLGGMAMLRAGADACGLAVLSLGNLQGGWMTVRGGALPIYEVRPDPEKPPTCFAHDGPVTGLIDADMKPLRGPMGRGEPVIERRGGPVVRRTITTGERAAICAQLFVQSWRAAGSRSVKAVRPRMGLDFNDAIREASQ